MSKVIKISDKTNRELENRRHLGQSYDGVIQELLLEVEKLRASPSKQKGEQKCRGGQEKQ